jgi:hypothetical protein
MGFVSGVRDHRQTDLEQQNSWPIHAHVPHCTCCHIGPHHTTPHHMHSYRITSYNIASYHTVSHRVTPHHIFAVSGIWIDAAVATSARFAAAASSRLSFCSRSYDSSPLISSSTSVVCVQIAATTLRSKREVIVRDRSKQTGKESTSACYCCLARQLHNTVYAYRLLLYL